jgi:hypothetical protein
VKRLTTWLYQFWLFSYKTVKQWGSGPTEWTRETLEFHKYGDTRSVHSPSTSAIGFDAHGSDKPMATAGDHEDYHLIEKPCSLCRWSIHVITPSMNYSIDRSDQAGIWTAYSSNLQPLKVEQKLYEGLASNQLVLLKSAVYPLPRRRSSKQLVILQKNSWGRRLASLSWQGTRKCLTKSFTASTEVSVWT